MVVRKLIVVVVSAVLALALLGCSDVANINARRAESAKAFGLPEMPVMQGILDLSPTRAVGILDNFEYREHEGAGQWANTASVFDVYDDGTQATLDKEMASGEAGWILQLYSADGTAWRSCTIDDLKNGADPDKAVLLLFPSKGASFDSANRAIEFIDALYMTRMGAVAVDTSASPGRLIFGVAKNPTGAVYQIAENAPGAFTLTVYPNSYWIDGSYDELVAECSKQAETLGCTYHEFTMNG